jgi:glycosyltransferase involved in cell wall biosynthesis
MTGQHSRETQAAALYDVSIVGTVGLPARYGGFETLAEQLSHRLQDNLRVQVFCTTKGRTDGCPAKYQNTDLQYVSWDANGWQSIPYDFVSLWRAAPKSKALLILGVSGCLLLPVIRWRSPKTKLVVNIDGLEWCREKWGPLARWMLRMSEKAAVKYADIVVADNQGIKDQVQAAYGKSAALIAYGGDQVAQVVPAGCVVDTRFAAGDYFLAICRIEPENNIESILDAFAAVPQQHIVVVGNWAGSEFARRTRAKYGNYTNIELKDAIYDQGRLAALRAGAKACVHGHSAGGTNPSLVEAMSFGMAVLAYDVNYNRFTTANKACYWVGSTELATLITELSDRQLNDNARAMHQLAQEHYTWDKIVAAYAAAIGA